jgi:hypothetical protein
VNEYEALLRQTTENNPKVLGIYRSIFSSGFSIFSIGICNSSNKVEHYDKVKSAGLMCLQLCKRQKTKKLT